MAKGFIETAEMICGKQEDLIYFGFYEGDNLLDFSAVIKNQVDLFINQNKEVVCLVDLPGATPFNACAIALAETKYSVVAGISLPFLLELLMSRNNDQEYKVIISESLESAVDSMKMFNIEEMFN